MQKFRKNFAPDADGGDQQRWLHLHQCMHLTQMSRARRRQVAGCIGIEQTVKMASNGFRQRLDLFSIQITHDFLRFVIEDECVTELVDEMSNNTLDMRSRRSQKFGAMGRERVTPYRQTRRFGIRIRYRTPTSSTWIPCALCGGRAARQPGAATCRC